MPRMEMRCGNTKCERCGKESVITIWHKSYDANLCGDCYKDADKNKRLFLTGVELAPVVHAHWAYEIDDLFPADSMMICSNCGEYERLGANDNYCGNCGAKMDEVIE